MKVRNYRFYGDAETVKRLADEYRWIGRDVKVTLEKGHGHLTVLALPPKKSKKRDDE